MLRQCMDSVRVVVRGVVGLSRAGLRTQPVDPQSLADRRRLCAQCDCATHRRPMGVANLHRLTARSSCQVCRCLIAAKTSVRGETCPLQRW